MLRVFVVFLFAELLLACCWGVVRVVPTGAALFLFRVIHTPSRGLPVTPSLT
jgi:hypothetical protein